MAQLKAYEKEIAEETFLIDMLNVFIGENAEVVANSTLHPNCQT